MLCGIHVYMTKVSPRAKRPGITPQLAVRQPGVVADNTMNTVTTAPTSTRRRYGPGLKTKILAKCSGPDASVAKIAIAYGINANIVHSWSKRARRAAIQTSLNEYENGVGSYPST